MVITSPPYLFVLDYVENDRHALEFLNVDLDTLRKKMLGDKYSYPCRILGADGDYIRKYVQSFEKGEIYDSLCWIS